MQADNVVSKHTKMGKQIGEYTLRRVLGKGKYGVVSQGIHHKSGKQFAVKQIDKNMMKQDSHLQRLFKTEVTIMNEINHPNILHLYDFLESEQNYYLVITFCNKGSLQDLLTKQPSKCFQEREAISFLKQILNAFIELRKKKILHRDIKLDNIFMNNKRVVIGDFGFAKMGSDFAVSKLGTPYTMAYELLTADENESYSTKADIWSIGVIYYQLLFGHPPFEGTSIVDLINNIEKYANNNLKFPKATSKQSKNLLNRILVTDPDDRIDWFELFNHPVFKMPLPQSNNGFVNEVEHQTTQEFQKNLQESHLYSQTKFLDNNNLVKNYQNKTMKARRIDTIADSQNKFKNHLMLNLFRDRIQHEKKIIKFMSNTNKKLKHCLKIKLFFNLYEDFFNIQVLIFKKIDLFLKFLKRQLENNIKFFCPQIEDEEKIRKSFDYQDFQGYLQRKIVKNNSCLMGLIDKSQEKEITLKHQSEILSKYSKIEQINGFIQEYYNTLKKFVSSKPSISEEEKKYFEFIFLLVKCSLRSDLILKFRNPQKGDKKFDWKDFYARMKDIKHKAKSSIF